MPEKNAKVYIIILNYRNWPDTLECLESVFRLNYPDYQVILVDNNSENESVEKINLWLENRLNVWTSSSNLLKRFISPPLDKQVENSKKENGCTEFQIVIRKNKWVKPVVLKMTFFMLKENLGFAGANNVALKHALSLGDLDFAWLLNNDTIPDTDSLLKLTERAGRDPKIGISGSKLNMYYQPEKIQAIGGTINPWLGITGHIKEVKDLVKLKDIIGASFMISKKCLSVAGLLPEEYFLYREETAYCIYATRCGFSLLAVPDSVVYHKEGAGTLKYFQDYYTARNSLYLFRKFYPNQFITAAPYLHLRMIFSKILFSEWYRLKPTLLGIRDFWRNKMGKYPNEKT